MKKSPWHLLSPSCRHESVNRRFPSPRLLPAAEFLLYALLAAFALRASWLTWPDAFVDFSRELYLPWRVACGEVLYRDLAYYFGPLSVHVNAALFALVGRPSIHALFALNAAFWLATLLALRVLLRRVARPAVAALCVCGFILLFSFNRYLLVGNYNFLAPYSHELPRGFLLALLALLALDSAIRRRSALLALPAGFFLGLSLFTKPEIALAAVASCALLLGAAGRPSVRSLLLPSAAGALVALAAVLLPLSIALRSFPRALHDGLLKLYLDCFDPAVNSLPFFKGVLGTDAPLPHLLRLLSGGVLAAAPFVLLRLLARGSARLRTHLRHLRRCEGVWISIPVLLAAAIGFFAFAPLNAALPLAPAALLAVLFRGRGRCARRNAGLAAAFALFALVLSAKMALAAHIWHYGFVLALPAFCCAVLLPSAVRGSPAPPGPAYPAACLALLLGFSAAALRMQSRTLRQWDIASPIHDGAFLAPAFQAEAFNAALGWIRSETAPESTLAVLPEGAILNVLSGRANPTPYVSLPATDIPRYPPGALPAAYSNALPDTLVLAAKLGEARFGTDYAQDLMALLAPHYTPAFTVSLPSPSGPVPYLLLARRNRLRTHPVPPRPEVVFAAGRARQLVSAPPDRAAKTGDLRACGNKTRHHDLVAIAGDDLFWQ